MILSMNDLDDFDGGYAHTTQKLWEMPRRNPDLVGCNGQLCM